MAWIFKPCKIKVSLISGHAGLFKTISIPFFACSLIFKSLNMKRSYAITFERYQDIAILDFSNIIVSTGKVLAGLVATSYRP